jgi:hypothetical protein
MIMKNHQDAFALFLPLLFGMMFLLTCEQTVDGASFDKDTLEKSLSQIDPWPNWSTNYAQTNWVKLVKLAKSLQQMNPEIVEAALSNYQGRRGNLLDEDAIRDDGKVYLLMRIVFDLPESTPMGKGTRYFAGWVSQRTEVNADGTVSLAWPIAWNRGHPMLISGCIGLQGINARYRAAAEYDYFYHKYKMRDLSAW